MNTKYHLTAVFALVITGVLAFGAGCAKMRGETGADLAKKTTESMQAVNTDMSQASMQIDAVKVSLDRLLAIGQSPAALPDDVKVAYEAFSDHVDKMNKISDQLSKDINEMDKQGNKYFLEWAKEGGTYTDPNIQKLSAERRARLNSTFREMQSAAASVRANLNTYLNDLDQVKTYLSNDLTPQGIAGISWIAGAVERNGDKLKLSFKPVGTSIMHARAEMTPGMGAAAGGGQGAGTQPETNK